MAIKAQDVAQLRAATGVGIMEAKKALEEAQGDFGRAIAILRQAGAIKAAAKIQRLAQEGVVVSYIHGNNKLGVLLELNCETDFVARTDTFKSLANDLAMQVAAMNPLYISTEQSQDSIEVGEEAVLLDQAFIKDTSITIKERIDQAVHQLGENIRVARFARFAIDSVPSVCNGEDQNARDAK